MIKRGLAGLVGVDDNKIKSFYRVNKERRTRKKTKFFIYTKKKEKNYYFKLRNP